MSRGFLLNDIPKATIKGINLVRKVIVHLFKENEIQIGQTQNMYSQLY